MSYLYFWSYNLCEKESIVWKVWYVSLYFDQDMMIDQDILIENIEKLDSVYLVINILLFVKVQILLKDHYDQKDLCSNSSQAPFWPSLSIYIMFDHL